MEILLLIMMLPCAVVVIHQLRDSKDWFGVLCNMLWVFGWFILFFGILGLWPAQRVTMLLWIINFGVIMLVCLIDRLRRGKGKSSTRNNDNAGLRPWERE